jgi:cell division protein FtsB
MLVRFLTKKNIDIKNRGKQHAGAILRQEKTPSSVLFSRGKMSNEFFTEDSKLYITPREQKMLRSGVKLDRNVKKWDSLSSRIVENFVRLQPSRTSKLLELWNEHSAMLKERSEMLNDSFAEISQNFVGQFSKQFSLVRVWNMSIIGSVLFGMVIMTFFYRYLGQGASAEQLHQVSAAEQQTAEPGKVLGAEDSANNDATTFTKQVLEIEQVANQQALEKEINQMVKGYPIERMVPYIAKKDRTVAAFMIAIAKKESSWGTHVPVLRGQDCYNYWGYREQRKLMGTDGNTCFNSPQDAVDTVANRISTLVEKYDKSTPAEMVVWKCGSDCNATGGQAAANKWISDVTMYFDELNGK